MAACCQVQGWTARLVPRQAVTLHSEGLHHFQLPPPTLPYPILLLSPPCSKVEVFCYALTPSDGSEWRAHIEAEAEHFVDVSSSTAADIARRISADGIHVSGSEGGPGGVLRPPWATAIAGRCRHRCRHCCCRCRCAS